MENQTRLTESLPMVEQPLFIISLEEENSDFQPATTTSEVPSQHQKSDSAFKSTDEGQMDFVEELKETTKTQKQKQSCCFVQVVEDIDERGNNGKYLCWSVIIASTLFSPLLISLITGMIFFSRFNRTATICFGVLLLATLTAMVCLCRKNKRLDQHLLCTETKFTSIHE